jgi:hypothetical protein
LAGPRILCLVVIIDAYATRVGSARPIYVSKEANCGPVLASQISAIGFVGPLLLKFKRAERTSLWTRPNSIPVLLTNYKLDTFCTEKVIVLVFASVVSKRDKTLIARKASY